MIRNIKYQGNIYKTRLKNLHNKMAYLSETTEFQAKLREAIIKAIKTTLVIENKQSIGLAADKRMAIDMDDFHIGQHE